jgi:hypothetical protein
MRITSIVLAFVVGAAGAVLTSAASAPAPACAVERAAAPARAATTAVPEARAAVYRRGDGRMVVACVAEPWPAADSAPAPAAAVRDPGRSAWAPLPRGGIEVTLTAPPAGASGQIRGVCVRDLTGRGAYGAIRPDGRLDLGRVPPGTYRVEVYGGDPDAGEEEWGAMTAPFYHDGVQRRHDLALVDLRTPFSHG